MLVTAGLKVLGNGHDPARASEFLKIAFLLLKSTRDHLPVFEMHTCSYDHL